MGIWELLLIINRLHSTMEEESESQKW